MNAYNHNVTILTVKTAPKNKTKDVLLPSGARVKIAFEESAPPTRAKVHKITRSHSGAKPIFQFWESP